ncbi:AAA family ATPase, partial [Vibrio metoecus]
QLMKDKLTDSQVMKQVQEMFFDAELGDKLTYITYDYEPKGEIWRKQNFYPNIVHEEELDNLVRDQEPLAFIYQEDRVMLHSRSNDEGEQEKSRFYRSVYRSSIDDRFEYLRNAIQVRESFYYKKMANLFSKLSPESFSFDDVVKSDSYLEVSKKLEEIESVLKSLNSYFELSGKKVVRDENNKYTLALLKDEDTPICWNLLSRGEKTLLYLFFAIYYFKERVNVFLLDEPDISLHVSWQENLIRDLVSIAPNNQFIVATHSPSLVMKGWLPYCLELQV